jgi:hypothetical protein
VRFPSFASRLRLDWNSFLTTNLVFKMEYSV